MVKFTAEELYPEHWSFILFGCLSNQGRILYGCPCIPGNTVPVADLLHPVDSGYVARVVVLAM
jgi:uncharacterized protein (DUF433 family)